MTDMIDQDDAARVRPAKPSEVNMHEELIERLLATYTMASNRTVPTITAGPVRSIIAASPVVYRNPDGPAAAATIAALRAENARAKLDGVRAGIALTAEAAMTWAKECAPEYVEHLEALGHSMIRALSPATIAAMLGEK